MSSSPRPRVSMPLRNSITPATAIGTAISSADSGEIAEHAEHAEARAEDAAELGAGRDHARAGAAQVHRVDLGRIGDQHRDHAAELTSSSAVVDDHRQRRTAPASRPSREEHQQRQRGQAR